MSVAARTTQPMSVPWVTARNGHPTRILVTLERRVTLVVEDGDRPVADPNARVLAVELVALLTIEGARHNVLEQRRVRAHASDVAQFAAAVLEQLELACHLCPGIDIAITRDDAQIWHPLRVGLAGLVIDGQPVAVADVVETAPPTNEDIELTRRARRRSVIAAGTSPPPYR